MRVLSGALAAGTEKIGRLLDIGIGPGGIPWAVIIGTPGAGATVSFEIGPTATGPWRPILSVTADDGDKMSDASNGFYYRAAVSGATTNEAFRLDVA